MCLGVTLQVQQILAHESREEGNRRDDHVKQQSHDERADDSMEQQAKLSPKPIQRRQQPRSDGRQGSERNGDGERPPTHRPAEQERPKPDESKDHGKHDAE